MDYDWWSKYIYCFYWAMQTMITIGYGDNPPVTINL
ncbi:MAG: ion channel [bacterium]